MIDAIQPTSMTDLQGFAFAGGERSAPLDAKRNFALGRPGYCFADLFAPARLAELDTAFRMELAAADPELAARFEAYRGGAAGEPTADSELLIAVSRHLSRFVAVLFGNQAPRQRLLDVAGREAAVFRMKEFVARRAIKKHAAGTIDGAEAPGLREAVAKLGRSWHPRPTPTPSCAWPWRSPGCSTRSRPWPAPRRRAS
jgi:hypothetical protein